LLIWKLPMPPVWFWLLVLGIIILYIYILKRVLETEEKYVPSSVEDRLKWKMTQLKFFEIVAWIFMAAGVIIYVYGIVNSSPFIIFFIGSCLVLVGYLVATYYRKQRRANKKEPKEKQQS